MEKKEGFCTTCGIEVDIEGKCEDGTFWHLLQEHHPNCDPSEGCDNQCPIVVQCGPVTPKGVTRG